jgi:hypothetical protein
VMVLLVLSVRPHCRGRVVRRSAGSGPEYLAPAGARAGLGPAGWPEGVQPATTWTVCQPLEPAGKGAARSSVCTSPSAPVARTVIECRPVGKS